MFVRRKRRPRKSSRLNRKTTIRDLWNLQTKMWLIVQSTNIYRYIWNCPDSASHLCRFSHLLYNSPGTRHHFWIYTARIRVSCRSYRSQRRRRRSVKGFCRVRVAHFCCCVDLCKSAKLKVFPRVQLGMSWRRYPVTVTRTLIRIVRFSPRHTC